MTLFQTVAPAAEPVTLAEAKAHMRIDHESEDELIGGLIAAARQETERTASLALIEQDWRLTLDTWPPGNIVWLDRHPVQQVLSVTVFDADGAAALVPPQDYQLDASTRPARLLFQRRIEPGLCMNGIEIDFRAGFGGAGTDVPDLIKRAILVLVAHWYEFRATYDGNSQPVSYPQGYDRLVAGYRKRRL